MEQLLPQNKVNRLCFMLFSKRKAVDMEIQMKDENDKFVQTFAPLGLFYSVTDEIKASLDLMLLPPSSCYLQLHIDRASYVDRVKTINYVIG